MTSRKKATGRKTAARGKKSGGKKPTRTKKTASRSRTALRRSSATAVLESPVSRTRRPSSIGARGTRARPVVPTVHPRVREAKRLAVDRYLATPETLATTRIRAVDPRPRWNVLGIGIGPPRQWGRGIVNHTIRFYIEAKLPLRAIPPDARLPKEIEGVPTEVVETGRFVAHRSAAIDPKARLRPARPGCSLGFVPPAGDPPLRNVGTFGAVIRAAGQLGILSNNHVLADENKMPLGTPIVQPGTYDGGLPGSDVIARLAHFVPLQVSGNRVDAAYALAVANDRVDPALLPPLGRLASAEPIEAVTGAGVAKVGRTTDYTEGFVDDPSADLLVEYDRGAIGFVDQILIRRDDGSFSEPGDSGSLVIDLTTRHPLGLLIGGAGNLSIANPIAEVLSQLQVVIVV